MTKHAPANGPRPLSTPTALSFSTLAFPLGALAVVGGLFGSLTIKENIGLPLREHTGLAPMLIMSGGAVSRLGHDVIEWPAFVVENLIFEGLLTLASASKE